MTNQLVERDFVENIDCSEAIFLDNPQTPMLKRVKILGTISENDREYTLEAKSDAIGRKLYENARVNINHPDDPHKSRVFEDRFGFITQPVIEERDIYGNLSWNPEHPWANTFKWWAKNAPHCIGLSHNAVGQGRDDNGKFIVEKIVKVRSVDLVADPATTKSLFEARNAMPENKQDNQTNVVQPVVEAKPAEKPVDTIENRMGNAVCSILKDTKLTTEEKIQKLLVGTKLITEGQTVKVKKVSEEDESEEEKKKKEEEEKKKKGEEKKVEESVSIPTVDTSLKELCESVSSKLDSREKFYADRVDALESKKAYESAKDKGRKLCQEAKLPEKLVTTVFLNDLAECKDEKEMKSLIEDKKAVLEAITHNPPARPAKEAKDIATDDFVGALKGSKKLNLQ